MGKITGFLEIDRQDRKYAPAADRVRNYNEFVIPLGDEGTKKQAARCMDCGIPYCHNGCPVNNQIPDWNDLVYNNRWEEASRNLHSTNNFPEFTGRVCPAPCETSCTLNLEDMPVTIKSIECAIVDKAWENGWVKPIIATEKTGKKVAVIGGGPAGLAAAQQLARAGHNVHLFEKNAKVGGLMRYGIPDFKMEKHLIDRRVDQMEAEGVIFHYGAHIGVTQDAKQLTDSFDAVLMCAVRKKAATYLSPVVTLQAYISLWNSCLNKTAACQRKARSTITPFSQLENMLLLSAAVTRVPTALVHPSVRVPCLSPKSKSCQPPLKRKTRSWSGPTGP
jgi:glutamate synthase (NADPH) small chain